MMRRSWGVVLAAVLLTATGLTTAATAETPVAPVNQVAPKVTGSARVGELLTAAPGTWSPAAASYAYTWLRDGKPIAKAAARTYRLVAADHAHRLVVRVVATGADARVSEPADSAPTAAVASPRLVVTGKPTISGTRRWGRTLTATSGSWSAKPTSYRYRWSRDGVAISGATKAKRTLTVADYGHHLTVRVTAVREGYANGTATSAPTRAIDHRVGVRKRFTYSIATRGRITASMKTFAKLAAETYADPRGWRAAGYSFRRVARGGDFTLVLSAASSVPGFGSPCSSTWSCRVGRYVIINQTRWLHASPAWNSAHQPLRDYRHMVVDHETGHWLGHRHRTCPGPGRLAPIMMQQSKGLHGCRFNPFPLASERWTSR